MSDNGKPFKAYAIPPEHLDKIEEDQLELHKSVAVLAERVEHLSEKIEHSTECTDKLVEKMEGWMEHTRKAENRLEKVEEYVENGKSRKRLIKSGSWALFIAGASVLATKLAEVLWGMLVK
jgi:predicted  nucleic acid-binding Zn-ribbon protein